MNGTPGVSTSAAMFDQSIWRKSAVPKPACAACAILAALSSQAMTSAPPARKAWQLASPEPPRPKTATFLPAKVVTGIIYRSFSVDSPASASTTAMIQNRITICGSVQPFCSK